MKWYVSQSNFKLCSYFFQNLYARVCYSQNYQGYSKNMYTNVQNILMEVRRQVYHRVICHFVMLKIRTFIRTHHSVPLFFILVNHSKSVNLYILKSNALVLLFDVQTDASFKVFLGHRVTLCQLCKSLCSIFMPWFMYACMPVFDKDNGFFVIIKQHPISLPFRNQIICTR